MQELIRIEVDYEDPGYPQPVRAFRPAVYKEKEGYCCILGPDIHTSIHGCGPTVFEAMQRWTQAFDKRLATAGEEDVIVTEIRDNLSIQKKDVW